MLVKKIEACKTHIAYSIYSLKSFGVTNLKKNVKIIEKSMQNVNLFMDYFQFNTAKDFCSSLK